jgi:hypothetical protein
MKSCGELTGSQHYRTIVESPSITIISSFKLELLRNDVPTTIHYKHGVRPWKSILINNKFTSDMVPSGSEIYLSASVNRDEIVQYSIEY